MTGQINKARLYSLHHRAMNTMKNEILESSILVMKTQKALQKNQINLAG